MKVLSRSMLFGAVIVAALAAHTAEVRAEGTTATTPAVNTAQAPLDASVITSRIDRLSKRLDLTAEQRTALKPIMEDEAVKLRELRGIRGLNPAGRQARLQEIRQATSDRMRPILTPAQQQKLDEFRKELRERGRSRMISPTKPSVPSK